MRILKILCDKYNHGSSSGVVGSVVGRLCSRFEFDSCYGQKNMFFIWLLSLRKAMVNERVVFLPSHASLLRRSEPEFPYTLKTIYKTNTSREYAERLATYRTPLTAREEEYI